MTATDMQTTLDMGDALLALRNVGFIVAFVVLPLLARRSR